MAEIILACALVVANLLAYAFLASRLDAIVEQLERRADGQAEQLRQIGMMYHGTQEMLWRAGYGISNRPKNEKRMVYFIADDALTVVKIGVATNPEYRLHALQTSHSVPLKLIATMEGGVNMESVLHKLFADLRKRGEWFEANESLLAYIQENAIPYPPTNGLQSEIEEAG